MDSQSYSLLLVQSIFHHPMRVFICFSNACCRSGFVKRSAGCTSVRMCFTSTVPSSTYCWKWCSHMLRCLVRGLYLSLRAISNATLLSSYTWHVIFVFLDTTGNPYSFISRNNGIMGIVSLVTYDRPVYSLCRKW